MEREKYHSQYSKRIGDYYLPEKQLDHSAMPAEAVGISKDNNARHIILAKDDGDGRKRRNDYDEILLVERLQTNDYCYN